MRIKCTVSYDGTNYNGFQIQTNAKSVQGEIEKVLSKMHDVDRVQIHASGRTDKGVHARGQVFHFDSDLPMHEAAWKRSINAQLPKDIFIEKVELVSDDFHARYCATAKQYSYLVNHHSDGDVFMRNFELHYTYKLDFEKMKCAMKYFLGTHDFTTFCSAKNEKVDCVRTIYRFDMIHETENRIRFVVYGDGFLYNMVRIMVGTVLDVGRGRFAPEEILQMLEGKNRKLAGKTAAAHGLYLDYVVYDN